MENDYYQIKDDAEKIERSNINNGNTFMESSIAILVAIVVAISHEKIILSWLDPILGKLPIQYRSVAISFSLFLGPPFIISSVLFYVYSKKTLKSLFVGFFTVIVWFLFSVLTWRIV